MALTTGSRIGPYEIKSPLGEGGMGVVFRALDTKLQRDVALKLLPDHFADDRDRLARFQREAQVLASLNHPNIAQIYGLEDSTEQTCIVMELVEGETLQERLQRGAIPIDEALPIAKQIAEALEAAHERGIIHRDLKPANIKITADGKVKVLDFGLAKIRESFSATPNLSQSPTMMTAPTGVILGTAAYMSPEHAKGREADRTTDVWAFGCVLYEMLTGQPAFTGETVTDILARVVTFEPDWAALPVFTPLEIQQVLKRCLRKDRKQRLHDICDARIEIDEALNDPVRRETEVIPARNNRKWFAWIAVALFLGVALGAALFFVMRSPVNAPSADAISFSVFPPEKTAFSAVINRTVNIPQFALSPDGRALVFSAEPPGARPVLWLRSMDQVAAKELAGTEDAQDPFWSPDGRWIGFFAAG